MRAVRISLLLRGSQILVRQKGRLLMITDGHWEELLINIVRKAPGLSSVGGNGKHVIREVRIGGRLILIGRSIPYVPRSPSLNGGVENGRS